MTNSQKESRPVEWIQRTWLIAFLLLAGTGWSSGQALERLSIPFEENGRTPAFPLAGGLNSPQFSAVDLNKDGRPDLHVFDRVGNRQLTFVNNGSDSDFPYTYAPDYAENFPNITNWMLLRDYNRDGIMDIFAYADQVFDAVMVFTGYYAGDSIRFERVRFNGPRNIIYVPAATGQTQLYVSSIDYPAVDDVDCDGDLDMLTFNIAGGYLEWFANESVERGFGTDSLIYRLRDNCWGGFYESGIGNAVDLAARAGDCVDFLQGEERLEKRHSGSTVLTLDIDGDEDKDLILGDVSFTELNFLRNGGTCAEAWMNAQDPNFPAYDVPAEVLFFPASFYLDVDQDGRSDLLVAPNADLNAVDREIWWYQNIGTAEVPVFQLRQKDFMVEEMIDLGSGLRPVFIDYDADGLLDLLLANYSLQEEVGVRNASLFLYRNVGSKSEPAYRLVDDDYLNFNQFSPTAYAFTPTFGDLDSDGDLDAVVGEQNGRLFYLENIAGAGQPLAFAAAQYDYMGIDVGQASVPQLIDLDRDGLLDLIVGERNGNINFFRNRGSDDGPDFAPEPDQMVLGGVDARVPGFTTGYSSPTFFESDGRLLLLTGTEIGRLELYDNIEGALDGSFRLVTETFGEVRAGIRTHPALADIDNDGRLELAVGNFSGGLSIFRTGLEGMPPVGTKQAVRLLDDLEIWPNPARGEVNISLPVPETDGELSVFNIQGQLLFRRSWRGVEQVLQVSKWAGGVYWIQIRTRESIRTGRLVVQ